MYTQPISDETVNKILYQQVRLTKTNLLRELDFGDIFKNDISGGEAVFFFCIGTTSAHIRLKYIRRTSDG